MGHEIPKQLREIIKRRYSSHKYKLSYEEIENIFIQNFIEGFICFYCKINKCQEKLQKK